jgi:hypothetical protein
MESRVSGEGGQKHIDHCKEAKLVYNVPLACNITAMLIIRHAELCYSPKSKSFKSYNPRTPQIPSC